MQTDNGAVNWGFLSSSLTIFAALLCAFAVKSFRLDRLAHDKQTRIAAVENKDTVLGLIVDSVSEVLRIPAETVEPPLYFGQAVREYAFAERDHGNYFAAQVDDALHKLGLGVFSQAAVGPMQKCPEREISGNLPSYSLLHPITGDNR